MLQLQKQAQQTNGQQETANNKTTDVIENHKMEATPSQIKKTLRLKINLS